VGGLPNVDVVETIVIASGLRGVSVSWRACIFGPRELRRGGGGHALDKVSLYNEDVEGV
jgi:hypothetical protein